MEAGTALNGNAAGSAGGLGRADGAGRQGGKLRLLVRGEVVLVVVGRDPRDLGVRRRHLIDTAQREDTITTSSERCTDVGNVKVVMNLS